MAINDKLVKLAKQDYDWRKQKMIAKTIDQTEIDLLREPLVEAIDQLRREEAAVLAEINEAQ